MQVVWVLKLKAEDFVIRTLKPLGWYVGLREVNQKKSQFWPYFRCMLRFKISLELPWMWDVFLTQVHVFYWLCVCVFYEIQDFQCLVILRKEASHISIHTYDHGGSCQSLGILASEVNYFLWFCVLIACSFPCLCCCYPHFTLMIVEQRDPSFLQDNKLWWSQEIISGWLAPHHSPPFMTCRSLITIGFCSYMD